MKRMITVSAIALTTTGAAFADGHITSAEEYFAMSNDSAAERMVEETSMGDVTEAELRIALSSMNAAERKVFYESDDATRMEMLMAKRQLDDSDSPAEKVTN